MRGKQSKALNSSVVSAINPEWARSACHGSSCRCNAITIWDNVVKRRRKKRTG